MVNSKTRSRIILASDTRHLVLSFRFIYAYLKELSQPSAKEKSLEITHKEVRQLNLSNPKAVLSVDLLFTWHSKIAETDCQCRLRIYKITFDKAVVIVSELPDNPGRTITDEGLTLMIHLVCNKFALKPTRTMWLEHYPKGYLKDEETYEQVMLVQGNVYSKRINKQKIEALLGVKLLSVKLEL